MQVGDHEDQVGSLLQQVNLYDVRKKQLMGYSGDMKQRVGIAKALLGDSQLISVDEPTAGLDPMKQNLFRNLLPEPGEDNVVILFTHSVEEVCTLCNDMTIIGKGEVILTGKPDEVEESLNGKIGEKQIKKSDLKEYKEKYDVISNHFHIEKIMITVVTDNLSDQGFCKKHPTLEDVYFNLIQNQQKTTAL